MSFTIHIFILLKHYIYIYIYIYSLTSNRSIIVFIYPSQTELLNVHTSPKNIGSLYPPFKEKILFFAHPSLAKLSGLFTLPKKNI